MKSKKSLLNPQPQSDLHLLEEQTTDKIEASNPSPSPSPNPNPNSDVCEYLESIIGRFNQWLQNVENELKETLIISNTLDNDKTEQDMQNYDCINQPRSERLKIIYDQMTDHEFRMIRILDIGQKLVEKQSSTSDNEITSNQSSQPEYLLINEYLEFVAQNFCAVKEQLEKAICQGEIRELEERCSVIEAKIRLHSNNNYELPTDTSEDVVNSNNSGEIQIRLTWDKCEEYYLTIESVRNKLSKYYDTSNKMTYNECLTEIASIDSQLYDIEKEMDNHFLNSNMTDVPLMYFENYEYHDCQFECMPEILMDNEELITISSKETKANVQSHINQLIRHDSTNTCCYIFYPETKSISYIDSDIEYNKVTNSDALSIVPVIESYKIEFEVQWMPDDNVDEENATINMSSLMATINDVINTYIESNNSKVLPISQWFSSAFQSNQHMHLFFSLLEDSVKIINRKQNCEEIDADLYDHILTAETTFGEKFQNAYKFVHDLQRSNDIYDVFKEQLKTCDILVSQDISILSSIFNTVNQMWQYFLSSLLRQFPCQEKI